MSVPSTGSRFRAWIGTADLVGLKLGLLSLAVYLPGFRWGLPFASQPATVRGWVIDSVAGINTLAEVSNLLHPSVDWYAAYPVFHYLLLAVLYAPYLLYLKLTGDFAGPSAEYPFGLADPETALRVLVGIGQSASLLMGGATVAFAYYAGKVLGGRRAGIFAALMAMLSGPMVYYARTGNLDVPVQFWTAGGMLAGVYVAQRGLTVRSGALLGFLAALSVATKDQAYGIWLPALLYLIVRHLRKPETAAPQRWKPVAALAAAGTGMYALASGIVFWPGRFALHLDYLLHFEQTFFNVLHPTGMTLLRPPTFAGYAALLGDMAAALAEALGPIPLVLGAAGLVQLARHSPIARFLCMGLAGYVVLTVMPVRHMQYRYAIFPAFVLAIFAGVACAKLLAAPIPLRRWAGALLLATAVATEGFRALDLTWQMVNDARKGASAWLSAQARPGDRLGFYGALHQLPALPSWLTAVQLRDDSTGRLLREGEFRFVYVAPDYFSDPLHERSTFLPEETYAGLKDGTLGFRLAARFETPPLRTTWLRYFPYVNPPVQVFEAVP